MTKMRHKMTTKSKTTEKVINKTTETQNDNKETQGYLKQLTKQSKSQKAAFHLGDKEAQLQHRKTETSKHQRGKERLERDVNINNTKDMWQLIQNITGYKSAPIMCEARLPEELHPIYA